MNIKMLYKSRQWQAIAASVLLMSVIGCKNVGDKEQETARNMIVVDTDFVVQDNYYGGAVQWEPNDRDAMTDAQWERLFKRVEFMKLGYIRCCAMPYFYSFGYEGDKAMLQWEVDPSTINKEWYDNSTRWMNDLYKMLAFCDEQNIDVLLGEWWKPNTVEWRQAVPTNLPKYSLELDDPRYAAQFTALVKHLINDKGFKCIKQVNLGNEVNLMAGSPELGYTWEKWKKSIQYLHADLKRDGFEDIKIVGPDGGLWGDDLWFNKTLEQLNEEVTVIDYHWYINKDWTLSNRVEDETHMYRFFTQLNNKNKTNIWGEMGIRDGHYETMDQHTRIHEVWYGTFAADALIQTLRSGWSAGVAWGMDDAMHYKDDTDEQKRWGFWNSIAEQKGKPEETEIRPWFHTWSLLSRCFPKGSDILYSNSFRDQQLNCVAMRTPDGDISFAITNTANFSHSVTLQIPTVENNVTLNKYVYFEGDIPVDEDGFAIAKESIRNVDLKKGITINFPAEGCVILTTMGGPKPQIAKNEKVMVDPLIGIQRLHDYSKNLGANSFAKHYDSCGGETPNFKFGRVLFDYSTIHPSTNEESAYITYKFEGLSNFEVAVSGSKTIDGRFNVYASSDNQKWDEVPFAFDAPQLSVGAWYHTTLKPKNTLTGYNYLKIEMNPNGWFDSSVLREVKIYK